MEKTYKYITKKMKDYREQKKYYPTLVSNVFGIKEPGEGRIRAQKIQQLPQKSQDILFSDEIVDFIFDMERRYNLNDISTEEVSRSIRQYFLREITQEIFIQKISQICNTTEQEANQLLQKINSIVPGNLQEKNKKTIEMTLEDAIEKYPQILNQIITNKVIISKPFLTPLKPTLKNWIMVYEKVIGVELHSAIERGEFLFRSDAARGLFGDDRDKLSIILKSRDEKAPLSIDVDEKQIVFDKNQNNSVSEVNTKKIQQQIIPKKPQPKTIQNNLTPKINVKRTQPEIIQNNAQHLNNTQQNQNIITTNNLQKENHITSDIKQKAQQQVVANKPQFEINQNDKQQLNNANPNLNLGQNDNVINELQKEITKNRMELQGLQTNQNNVQNQQVQSVKPITNNNFSQPAQIRNQEEIGTVIQKGAQNNINLNNQKVIKEDQKPTQKQKKYTAGKITFSSTHILPVEKEKNL